MIKILLPTFLVASSVFFYGCQKTEAALVAAQDRLHNVSFSVSKHSEKTDALTSVTDSLKNFVYYIYTKDGVRLESTEKKINYFRSKVEIKEKLAPGSYKFIFFSSTLPLDKHVNDTPDEIPGFIYVNLHDIFHKAVEITVTPSGHIKQTVLLDKLNSTLEFDFSDLTIPGNISSLLITWNDDKYVDFNGVSFTSTRKQKSVKFDGVDRTKKIEKFTTSVINTSTAFNVYISFLDKNGIPVNGKEISNVMCFKNQKTVVSGYLFDEGFKEFTARVKL